MENSEICKFQRVFNMGYSYKNGLVSGVEQLDKSFIIYITIFKISNIWELNKIDTPPQTENVMYTIAKLEYKEDKCELLIYNEYPKEFVKEIIEGLKELGKMECDGCVHLHKRNLLKHNCSELYTKNKCNKQNKEIKNE